VFADVPYSVWAGETFELKADLNSEYKEKRKDAIQRTIANMVSFIVASTSVIINLSSQSDGWKGNQLSEDDQSCICNVQI
jgi:hypothetical protein